MYMKGTYKIILYEPNVFQPALLHTEDYLMKIVAMINNNFKD